MDSRSFSTEHHDARADRRRPVVSALLQNGREWWRVAQGASRPGGRRDGSGASLKSACWRSRCQGGVRADPAQAERARPATNTPPQGFPPDSLEGKPSEPTLGAASILTRGVQTQLGHNSPFWPGSAENGR